MFRTNGIKGKLLMGAASVALFMGATAGSNHVAYAEDYTTGTLNGTVQDESGAAVSGAAVVVSSTRGVNRTLVSGADGSFRLPQLPLGSYSVSISKAGYADLGDQAVSVNIGQSGSFTFTLDNMASGVEEVFVVGTRQASWDFNSTTTGITVNVGELFEKTPIARTGTSVALLAPGTGLGDSAFSGGQYGASGNLATFSGSSVGENVYYINGLNITNFRNAIGGSTVPFEFYEQIEVKTGGYQAEFGRSTGGVINAVTKSGSNDLHFGANAYWSPNALRETAPDTFAAVNSAAVTDNLEYNFWASGAIVEDKLFFFGLYNPRNNRALFCGNTRCTQQVRNEPFYGAKIDFVPFEGQRLEYTFFQDRQDGDRTQFNFDGTTVGSEIGSTAYHNGGVNHVFKYTGSFTDWFTLSAMYGENNYSRGLDSGIDTPSILEFRNGAPGNAVGDWVTGSFAFNADKRKAYRVDADFYFDLAGEHHVRVGWDKEQLNASEFTRYSGNVALRYYDIKVDHDDDPDTPTVKVGERVRARQYFNVGNFETNQTAAYIQDSWQVTDSLMLNIGFRNETFDNRNAIGETFVKTNNQKAWRFGFSWDPTEDGKNRVYGSWGRYYLPIATNTNIRMAGSEFYIQNYYELPGWDADPDLSSPWDSNTPYLTAPSTTSHVDLAGDADARYNTADGAALVPIGGTGVYGDGTQAGTAETTDTKLLPMYQDEWIVGGEHMFDNGWSIGLRYVHRNLGRMIEDIAIDAGVPIWAAANGYDAAEIAEIESIWSGFHQYVLTNPGGSVTVGTTDLPGSGGALVLMELTPDMLPYPKGKRTYDAVDFTFERDWDGLWSLKGSYTWSRSYGNYEGSVKSENGQDDAGLTTDFDQPGFTDHSEGLLPNDRTHRIKIWGSYQLTDQIVVGGKLGIESPRKQGCNGEHPTDGFAYWYGAASWYCGGQPTPRGKSMKTDWTKTVDLTMSFTPSISEQMPGDLTLRVDVFNVLNSASIRDRWEFGDQGFTSDLAFGGTTLPEPDPDYSKPTSYQAPRSVRLSASYTF